jgi:hypothetical protein
MSVILYVLDTLTINFRKYCGSAAYLKFSKLAVQDLQLPDDMSARPRRVPPRQLDRRNGTNCQRTAFSGFITIGFAYVDTLE